jgi:hypothetical protein
MGVAVNMTDTERLDWLENQAKRNPTGISFDWVPSVEGERSGFRFMRRFFIGEARTTLRAAIDAAASRKSALEAARGASHDPSDG